MQTFVSFNWQFKDVFMIDLTEKLGKSKFGEKVSQNHAVPPL